VISFGQAANFIPKGIDSDLTFFLLII